MRNCSVDRDLAHIFLSEAERDRRFFRREMGLFGDIDDQPRAHSLGAALGIDVFARCADGLQHRYRSRVIDNAEERCLAGRATGGSSLA